MSKPNLIIFDVNETLLDLGPLKQSIGKALNGREDLLPLWFTSLLHYSLVDTITDDYRSFSEIGSAVLVMIAERQGIELSASKAREAIEGPFRSLPPHADVIPSLKRLSAAGIRIICLANTATGDLKAQFEFAGISEFFEKQISTKEVGAFKPDPRTYVHGLSVVKEDPANVLMIAAHAWDLKGATKAGLRTAFIQRPGAQLYPHAERPDYVAAGLDELTDKLLA